MNQSGGDPGTAIGREDGSARPPDRDGAVDPVAQDGPSALEDRKVRQAELAISLVLRVGVGLAVILVVTGLIVVFARLGGQVPKAHRPSYKAYTSLSTPFPHSVSQLRTSIARGEGQGIIELGLVVLLLTPVLRVAVGVLTFLYEKDMRMALITLFVLIVLLGSFVIGGAS
ncbi:MAG: DUF1634 domain-containing protein [Acidimicrobiales bacterium]